MVHQTQPHCTITGPYEGIDNALTSAVAVSLASTKSEASVGSSSCRQPILVYPAHAAELLDRLVVEDTGQAWVAEIHGEIIGALWGRRTASTRPVTGQGSWLEVRDVRVLDSLALSAASYPSYTLAVQSALLRAVAKEIACFCVPAHSPLVVALQRAKWRLIGSVRGGQENVWVSPAGVGCGVPPYWLSHRSQMCPDLVEQAAAAAPTLLGRNAFVICEGCWLRSDGVQVAWFTQDDAYFCALCHESAVQQMRRRQTNRPVRQDNRARTPSAGSHTALLYEPQLEPSMLPLVIEPMQMRPDVVLCPVCGRSTSHRVAGEPCQYCQVALAGSVVMPIGIWADGETITQARTTCPSCQHVAATEAEAGALVLCPHCRRTFPAALDFVDVHRQPLLTTEAKPRQTTSHQDIPDNLSPKP